MLKRFFIGVLTFMLALTGQSMALARTAPAASGQMVLCIGATTVVVYVDQDGQPTEAPHVCPDCVLTFADTTAPCVACLPEAGYTRIEDSAETFCLITVKCHEGFLARAPPASA